MYRRHFCFGHLTRAEAVRLETITDSEVEARKLAAIHLDSLGLPLSAFVWLRPAVVARSVDYADLVAAYGPPIAASADGEALVH